jgi:glycosyltransferase involved in cell wall biosynthesis
MSVTLIIATIPGREEFLNRAFMSAVNQTKKPDVIMVAVDNDRLGAPRNRDKCVMSCTTDYVAMLDDDDYLLPNHIETLYNFAEKNNADLVYPSWVNLQGFVTHLDYIMNKEWNNNDIHQVPITWMAKTDTLKAVGGFSSNFDVMNNDVDEHGHRIGEDFIMLKKMVAGNYKIMHVHEITWAWNCANPASTQGRPDRW